MKVNVPLVEEEDSGDSTILQACAWSDGGAEFVFLDGTALIFRDEMRTFVALSPPTSRPERVGVAAPTNVFYTPLALEVYHAKLKVALMLYNRFTSHPQLIPSFFEDGAFSADGKPRERRRSSDDHRKPFGTHGVRTTRFSSPPPPPSSLSSSSTIPTSSFSPSTHPCRFPPSPSHYYLAKEERLLERCTVFATCPRDVVKVPPRPSSANDSTGRTRSKGDLSSASVSLHGDSPSRMAPPERWQNHHGMPSTVPMTPSKDNGKERTWSSRGEEEDENIAILSCASTSSSSPSPLPFTSPMASTSLISFPVGEEVTLWCVHHRVSLTLHWHQLLFTVRWPLQIDQEEEEGEEEKKRVFFMEQVFPVASPPPEWAFMLSLLWRMQMEATGKAEEGEAPPSLSYRLASPSSFSFSSSFSSYGAATVAGRDGFALPFPRGVVVTPTSRSMRHPSFIRFPSADPSHRLPLVTAMDIALASCQDRIRTGTPLRLSSSSSPPHLLWQWCRERSSHGATRAGVVSIYWFLPSTRFFTSLSSTTSTTELCSSPRRAEEPRMASPEDEEKEKAEVAPHEEVLLLQIDAVGAHPPLRLHRLHRESAEEMPHDFSCVRTSSSCNSAHHPSSLSPSRPLSFDAWKASLLRDVPSLPHDDRHRQEKIVSVGERPREEASWCALQLRRLGGVQKWYVIPEREWAEESHGEEGLRGAPRWGGIKWTTHDQNRRGVPAWAMAAVGNPLSLVFPPSSLSSSGALFSSGGVIRFSEADVLALHSVPSSSLCATLAYPGRHSDVLSHSPSTREVSSAVGLLSSLQGYAAFPACTAFAPFLTVTKTSSSTTRAEGGLCSTRQVTRRCGPSWTTPCEYEGRVAAITLVQVLVRHGKRLLCMGAPQWRTREPMGCEREMVPVRGRCGGLPSAWPPPRWAVRASTAEEEETPRHGYSSDPQETATWATSAAACLPSVGASPTLGFPLTASPTATDTMVLASVRVEGVGNFTAWNNGVVRGLFEDRTVLSLVPGPQHRMRRIYDPPPSNGKATREAEEEEEEEAFMKYIGGDGYAAGDGSAGFSVGLPGATACSPPHVISSHTVPTRYDRHGSSRERCRMPGTSVWTSCSTSLPSSSTFCASFFFLEGEESLVVRGMLGSGVGGRGAAGTRIVVRLVQLPHLGLLQSHPRDVRTEKKWEVAFRSSGGSSCHENNGYGWPRGNRGHGEEEEEQGAVHPPPSFASTSSFYACLLPYVDVLLEFRRRIVADLMQTSQEEEEMHNW